MILRMVVWLLVATSPPPIDCTSEFYRCWHMEPACYATKAPYGRGTPACEKVRACWKQYNRRCM